jgi:hypothetical protein
MSLRTHAINCHNSSCQNVVSTRSCNEASAYFCKQKFKMLHTLLFLRTDSQEEKEMEMINENL